MISNLTILFLLLYFSVLQSSDGRYDQETEIFIVITTCLSNTGPDIKSPIIKDNIVQCLVDFNNTISLQYYSI